jgi:hypothetical protein
MAGVPVESMAGFVIEATAGAPVESMAGFAVEAMAGIPVESVAGSAIDAIARVRIGSGAEIGQRNPTERRGRQHKDKSYASKRCAAESTGT